MKKIKEITKSIFQFIFVKPNEKESIIQWLLRNILIPDSSGTPSWTYTLSFWIMIIMSVVTTIEVKVATSLIKVMDPNTGKIISEQMKGFDQGFFICVVTLLGAIVFFIKFKTAGKAILTEDPIITPPNSQTVPYQIDPSTGQPIQQPTVQNTTSLGGVANSIGNILGKITK